MHNFTLFSREVKFQKKILIILEKRDFHWLLTRRSRDVGTLRHVEIIALRCLYFLLKEPQSCRKAPEQSSRLVTLETCIESDEDALPTTGQI